MSTATDFEVRACAVGLSLRSSDGVLKLEGYASTFDAYDYGPFREQIAPGAFRNALASAPDVVLNMNHGRAGSGLPLARTGSGRLRLAEDANGLLVSADLDPDDADCALLASKLRSGALSAMSFAFKDAIDSWSPDGTLRTIRSLSLDGGDVSVVANPANPATSVALRSRARALAPHSRPTAGAVGPDSLQLAQEQLILLRAGRAGR
ncbi:HK97 family phage prohead protease [Paraconexibacter antarcticus]|uniref:HK97 family phage prohead protease n=1 Tax=Paraconexibacter antarcticus TaxID=2949664 RepID=A0ABY5DN67_9ACTN|nr:HK97 family phage prohead protease [Paraconexibacter antarcticus]UTI62237.1 HK97 family phage prohead protease [Paraconexibacter antarcticus]